MKLQTFKNKLEAIEDYGVQALIDSDFMGSCPCFSGTVKVDTFTLAVWGRCWRVSEHGQDLYVGSDLPKKELREIAKMIKVRLDRQEWYGKYKLMIEPLEFFKDNNI